MSKNLKKLLSLSGKPLRSTVPGFPRTLLEEYALGGELYSMLSALNGFFTFESALHVFPLGTGEGMDLEVWNSASLWRSEYGGMADHLLFFSEDCFGHQFALHGSSVVTFNPETGEIADFASSLEDWAGQILDDYENLTGYPLIHEWQQQHGPIPPDHRLAPSIPFILGGDYSLANLYLAHSVALMRFNASLAVQIKDLPDGAPVNLKILPPSKDGG